MTFSKDPIKREEHILKIKLARTGRKASPETRLKQSLKRRGSDNVFWKGGKVKHICLNCKKEFFVFPCRVKSGRKYCSNSCRAEHFKVRFLGKNNPNWFNGNSFKPYCEKFNKDFKNRVRKFFNYTCGHCGLKQEDDPSKQSLHIHHINYKKDACCNPDSQPIFIALCSSCHGMVHYKRKYWNTCFEALIRTKYNGKCYLTKDEVKNV